MSSSRWNRTIYVGNLPGDIRMREVEDLFYKVLSNIFSVSLFEFIRIYLHVLLSNSVESSLQYGPIVDIDLKIPPRPPGYAFVEVFYDSRLKFNVSVFF